MLAPALLIAATLAQPARADNRACNQDSDCRLSRTCMGCNQCFSGSPLLDGLDCKAMCEPVIERRCQCSKGQCTAIDAPAKERWFLTARDGKQCELQTKAAAVAEAEKQSLASVGIKPAEVKVAFLLRADALPAACVPADSEAYFRKFPFAAERVKKSAGAVCEACGCPETWYFCVRAPDASALLLRAQGYAPLP